MKELEINDLYDKSNEDIISKFEENIQSKVRIKTDYEEIVKDLEWIDIMEVTIPYIDNIFRNPNRFIINEEEIVKIELARKITVDSIKHLSKNTNFIQEIDKKTGDVRPSKILNINKEESYDTYENRLIYTLVQNMKIFINKRKNAILQMENIPKKDDKVLEYTATSKVQNERVDIQLTLNTKYENSEVATGQKEIEQLIQRIEELEKKIVDVTCSEVYKILDKKHISLVTSPIKKTNVILKNVNFQYAMKLWDFLQENYEDKTKKINDQKDYLEEGKLKTLVDESFLVDYLILKTIEQQDKKDDSREEDNDDEIQETERKLKANMTNKIIEKLIDINPELTEEQLKNLLTSQFEVVKYKNLATIQEIQNIFKKHIDQYMETIK